MKSTTAKARLAIPMTKVWNETELWKFIKQGPFTLHYSALCLVIAVLMYFYRGFFTIFGWWV